MGKLEKIPYIYIYIKSVERQSDSSGKHSVNLSPFSINRHETIRIPIHNDMLWEVEPNLKEVPRDEKWVSLKSTKETRFFFKKKDDWFN